MKLAREGYSIIGYSLSAVVVLAGADIFLFETAYIPFWLFCIVGIILLYLGFMSVFFFREPINRNTGDDPDTVFSCVDGKVVVVEEIYENEFLHEKCIQVSVFMSINNIHANWTPISGKVIYRRNHPGRYLVAWHPKSSTENERTTTVIDTGKERILFRQIAGFVARRIVNYASVGQRQEQFSKYGFIKFGSRIDIFLPLGSDILVNIGDRVKGCVTPIAKLKH